MKINVELKQDVLDEIGFTTGINGETIDVSVNDGIVTLTGEVQSYRQKLVIAEAAKRISGIRAVANDLRVQLNESARRADSEITEAATNAIVWITTVPAESVKATVREGWLELSGFVQNSCDKIAVEDAVKTLTGVKGVTNLIRVEAHVCPG
jgi:osmotically-inducible protein OsmY